MTRTPLFRSGRLQAVRLSREVAFPEGVRSVMTLREGQRRVVVPADAVWDDVFDTPCVELADRDQPPAQGRDPF